MPANIVPIVSTVWSRIFDCTTAGSARQSTPAAKAASRVPPLAFCNPELQHDSLVILVLLIEKAPAVAAVEVLVLLRVALKLLLPLVGLDDATEDIVPVCNLRRREAG